MSEPEIEGFAEATDEQKQQWLDLLETHCQTKEMILREMIAHVAPEILSNLESAPLRIRAEFYPDKELYFVDNVLRLVMCSPSVVPMPNGKYKIQFQYEKHYEEPRNAQVH